MHADSLPAPTVPKRPLLPIQPEIAQQDLAALHGRQHRHLDTLRDSTAKPRCSGQQPHGMTKLPGVPPESQRMRIYIRRHSLALPQRSAMRIRNGKPQWAQPDWFCKKHGDTSWLEDDQDGQQSQGMQPCIPGERWIPTAPAGSKEMSISQVLSQN